MVEVYKNNGANWVSSQQLKEHEDGLDGDLFGSSHSIFGDTILIGVPGDKINGDTIGSARIHQKSNNTWQEQARIFTSDGEDGDAVGKKVILLTNQALVSATGQDTQGNNAGAVYYFNKTGMAWTESQKIMASDGAVDNAFGSEMKAIGDTLFISSMVGDENSPSKVYVFKFNGSNWVEQQKLQTGQIDDDFGQSIAIDNDRVFIGAPRDNKVYLYSNDNGNWVFQQFISIPVGDYGSYFGVSLNYFNGQLIVLSTIGSSDTQLYVNIFIHIFNENKNVWTNIESLYQSGAGFIQGYFSTDVAIENNNVVMTSYAFRDGIYNSVKIYFYTIINQQLNFIKDIRETTYGGEDSQMLVSISDDIAYVGSNTDFINGFSAGSVRVFDLTSLDSIFLNGFE